QAFELGYAVTVGLGFTDHGFTVGMDELEDRARQLHITVLSIDLGDGDAAADQAVLDHHSEVTLVLILGDFDLKTALVDTALIGVQPIVACRGLLLLQGVSARQQALELGYAVLGRLRSYEFVVGVIEIEDRTVKECAALFIHLLDGDAALDQAVLDLDTDIPLFLAFTDFDVQRQVQHVVARGSLILLQGVRAWQQVLELGYAVLGRLRSHEIVVGLIETNDIAVKLLAAVVINLVDGDAALDQLVLDLDLDVPALLALADDHVLNRHVQHLVPVRSLLLSDGVRAG